MTNIRNFSFYALEVGMRFYSPAMPTVFATIVRLDVGNGRAYYRWDGKPWTNYFCDNDINCVLVEDDKGNPLIDLSLVGQLDTLLHLGQRNFRKPPAKQRFSILRGLRELFDRTCELVTSQHNR